METLQYLNQICYHLQRALAEIIALQVQVTDRAVKDQLALISRQVGDMCWAIDRIIELQPLVEQFEGVDTAQRSASLDGMLTLWSSDSRYA